jgi:ATP-dependent RNA helicase DOB1
MDELFDAFAATSSASAAPSAIPAARASLKRPRAEDAAAAPEAAVAPGAAAAAAPLPAYGAGRLNLGASVVDGIARAGEFALEEVETGARGRAAFVEITVRPSGVAAPGAGALDADTEAEEEEEEGGGEAGRGGGATAGGGKGGGAAATEAGGGGDGASTLPPLPPAPGAAPPPRGPAWEIGEALRPQLARGEVDVTHTTAPLGVPPSAAARPPAREYKFVLDPFQVSAIGCLERDESVLVAAHTSAGKTVVAEYAIAMGLRDKQRVIYTSPIKALSNQKYRDFFEEFTDVGLMTGDVTINPNASVLVMTTEILRSMLYRGSEVMREVKWVVFDEVHYMRDKERGVVWEESIILLPHKVRFVFLSATIPNALEFVEWVSKIHHQTCHVVQTDYRPTPLQHFIFPAGGEGVFLVVDEKGRFREDNFAKAMAALGTTGLDDAVGEVMGGMGAGKRAHARKMGRGKGGPSDLHRIIKMVMERHMDPVIVFSFSKKECETYALQLKDIDFTSDEEKALVEEVFRNAIDALCEEDKGLPQIEAILPLLKRGIGIHHGGLLPILKEVIEILFQESLLKILFATETFSMGINMPARTVMFTASRKFDGTDFRWISPGEYIQMSGRAGRRGLDDRGIVIQMLDEKMEPEAAKVILKGTADPLNSAFHLGYNMLLNILRLEGGDPERLMALSFHQFQLERKAPALIAEAEVAEAARNTAERALGDAAAREALREFATLRGAAEAVRAAQAAIVARPEYATPFLQPGRVVRVIEPEGGREWGWGAVAGYSKRGTRGAADGGGGGGGVMGAGEAGLFVVADVFLWCAPLPPPGAPRGPPAPATPAHLAAGTAVLLPVPVMLSCIASFSSLRVFLPQDLKTEKGRAELGRALAEVQRRFSGGGGGGAPGAPAYPLLDPIEDMRVTSADYAALAEKAAALRARMAASPLAAAPDAPHLLAAFDAASAAAATAEALRAKVRACTALAQRDTLRRMKRVLRRLGHLSPDNVVQMKGRVAAEVNSADELLVTELIFNGVFTELDAAQAAALLSALVYTERSKADDGSAPPLREELAAPLRALQDAARRIASVAADCRVELDAEEYVASFNPGMMELVYAWVKGARFVDIIAMTKEFEGTIIRVVRRLEELTRQLADAAKAIGEEALETKFKEASTKIRRDIIFAASLYL